MLNAKCKNKKNTWVSQDLFQLHFEQPIRSVSHRPCQFNVFYINYIFATWEILTSSSLCFLVWEHWKTPKKNFFASFTHFNQMEELYVYCSVNDDDDDDDADAGSILTTEHRMICMSLTFLCAVRCNQIFYFIFFWFFERHVCQLRKSSSWNTTHIIQIEIVQYVLRVFRHLPLMPRALANKSHLNGKECLMWCTLLIIFHLLITICMHVHQQNSFVFLALYILRFENVFLLK